MEPFTIRQIRASDNEAIAKIIRENLEYFHLDIPGTAYFDKSLDTLSKFYQDTPGSRYFIATDEHGNVVGGVGIAPFAGFARCAEIQKLYLAQGVKGKGLGIALMQRAEEEAICTGYRQLYLETHSNLVAALHLYEKMGFRQIEKPASVLHSAMDRFYLKAI